MLGRMPRADFIFKKVGNKKGGWLECGDFSVFLPVPSICMLVVCLCSASCQPVQI